MAKSREQQAWEARRWDAARRNTPRGIAHPAEPIDDLGLWQIPCERPGCDTTFVTKTKQRRYCSDTCRREVEATRKRRMDTISKLVAATCARESCDIVFVPRQSRHRFCSTECRVASWRHSGQIALSVCLECGTPLVSPTTRTRYCGATCRKRSSRRRAQLGDTKC